MGDLNNKTEEILKYLSMVPKNSSKVTRYYIDMIKGKSEARGIMNNDRISVACIYTSDKSESAWHTHEEVEHLVLYEGDGYIIECIDKDGTHYDRKITLEKSCYILKNVPHRIKSVKGDCKSIVMLIPGSDEFPKGII